MGRACQNRKESMAKTSDAKARVYSKYGREIYVCAKAGGGEDFGPAIYEGYGPGGSMVMIECLTYNLGEIDFEVAEIQYLPQATTSISGDDVELFDKFLDMLNDLDDVQNIYHNVMFKETLLL